jgi:hypothetical protein
MVGWLIGGYALLVLCLMGFAGFVAVWVRDTRQRADAYRVLKLVIGAVAGSGGLLVVILKLAELGVL